MKKITISCLILFLCLTAVVGLLVPCLRNQHVNAHRSVVYRQMNMIREGVIACQKKDGQLPSSLIELEPAFIRPGVLDREPACAWMSRRVIVPDHPFGMRSTDRSFEITCLFFGDGYSQVVMNGITAEVRVE